MGMSVITWAAIILLIVYALIHTVSYAVWNWKNNNKAGSVFIILVCLVMVALPAYILFFRT